MCLSSVCLCQNDSSFGWSRRMQNSLIVADKKKPLNDTQTICCNVYIFWLYFFFSENVLCPCLRGVVAMTLWICQSDGRRVADGNWMKSNVWLKWSDKGDRKKLNRRYFVLISIFHLGNQLLRGFV